jgi:hypothetical protein
MQTEHYGASASAGALFVYSITMTAFLVRRFVGGKPEVELRAVEAETEIEAAERICGGPLSIAPRLYEEVDGVLSYSGMYFELSGACLSQPKLVAAETVGRPKGLSPAHALPGGSLGEPRSPALPVSCPYGCC